MWEKDGTATRGMPLSRQEEGVGPSALVQGPAWGRVGQSEKVQMREVGFVLR